MQRAYLGVTVKTLKHK